VESGCTRLLGRAVEVGREVCGVLCVAVTHARLSRGTDSLRGGVSAESTCSVPVGVGHGEGHGAAATPELVPRKSRSEYRALRAARARGLASDAEAPVARARSHLCDASEQNVSVPCCVCGSVIRGVVFVAANGGDAHMTCASTQLREITRVTAEASQRRRLKREASEIHAQRWALRTESATCSIPQS
jgi:hypothetical protein